jgi:hypothetical protein
MDSIDAIAYDIAKPGEAAKYVITICLDRRRDGWGKGARCVYKVSMRLAVLVN